MQKAQVAIVGAGLSGIYAAYTLEKMGIVDYVVLEARELPGGRILSTPGAADRFDLGPSWFWPGYQYRLEQVIRELGLSRYEQYETGKMVVDSSPDLPPRHMPGYVNSPPSMRLVGGMGALIDTLLSRLQQGRILTRQIVRAMRRTEHYVEVDSTNTSGQFTTWNVEQVLLALPPRLVEATIELSPALPLELSRSWAATPTWMAPHAKYFAVFDTPFWREQGLSGEGRSGVGPLVEIHDASVPQGSAALFGFIGVPASYRRALAEGDLRSLCRAQLMRMFGPQAGTPKAEFIKDWANDPFTTTDADLMNAGQHPEPPAATANSGPWRECLTGIGSEWSLQFPGYVAGTIDAVERGVQRLQGRQR